MAIGVTFFIVAALVVGVWFFIEFKRLRHKIVAIFLIALIIFTYVSFTVSLKNQDVDFKSVSGVIKAGRLYFAWLGGLFTNVKSITAYAFKQDWKSQELNVSNQTKLEEGIEVIEDLDTSAITDIWEKL